MNSRQHSAAINGIHHITAITSSAMENLFFYEEALGLRLVKQTVNFDDPYTYHLYYGDGAGAPGTILTFFPWEGLPTGRSGSGMVTAIAFAIPEYSVDFWLKRLQRLDIPAGKETRFGEPVITFTDPHGLALELIGTAETPATAVWQDRPIPGEHAIAGFHSATIVLQNIDNTRLLLTEVMGMSSVGRENSRVRFTMCDNSAPGHLLDVVADPDAPPAQQGGGTVHHIAFRTENSEAQAIWQKTLRQSGVPVTEVRDRKYFRSIYFHEPGGVLFEIATDPPGFAIDEDMRRLGERLQLPEQYESMRRAIQNQLPPLRVPEFRHIYVPSDSREENDETLVTLHGTGGDEQDLVTLPGRSPQQPRSSAPEAKSLKTGCPVFLNDWPTGYSTRRMLCSGLGNWRIF